MSAFESLWRHASDVGRDTSASIRQGGANVARTIERTGAQLAAIPERVANLRAAHLHAASEQLKLQDYQQRIAAFQTELGMRLQTHAAHTEERRLRNEKMQLDIDAQRLEAQLSGQAGQPYFNPRSGQMEQRAIVNGKVQAFDASGHPLAEQYRLDTAQKRLGLQRGRQQMDFAGAAEGRAERTFEETLKDLPMARETAKERLATLREQLKQLKDEPQNRAKREQLQREMHDQEMRLRWTAMAQRTAPRAATLADRLDAVGANTLSSLLKEAPRVQADALASELMRYLFPQDQQGIARAPADQALDGFFKGNQHYAEIAAVYRERIPNFDEKLREMFESYRRQSRDADARILQLIFTQLAQPGSPVDRAMRQR